MLRRFALLRPWAQRSFLTLAVLGRAGCGFFEELKNDPEVDEDDDEEAEDTEVTAVCEIASDDTCPDQDTLASCGQDGELRVVSCPTLCGSYTNFACVGTTSGRHACWCVEPGPQNVYACTELEACLNGCGVDTPCLDQCFAMTTAPTIRIFGALLHCAETRCADNCRSDPAGCPACISSTLATGCTIERALCDADDNDEPFPW